MACAMLQKNMPKIYVAKVAIMTMYLITKCMTKGVHDVTLRNKYFERKLDLLQLKVFGNIVCAHT